MNNLLIASEENFNDRIDFFRKLPLNETTEREKNGDELFGSFQVGNQIVKIDRPYERFHDYELLLTELQKIDKNKYENIHKGTAFYFLSWLAFDLKSYNKGIFYIDAAIAEDAEHEPDWQYGSAIQFYLLEQEDILSKRTVTKIKNFVESQLNRFSTETGISIQRQEFIDKFVKVVINDSNRTKRSLISAIYVFLLEFEDLYQLLKIRTAYGGSILPFIDHLFNGGLIFESLLKEVYPTEGNTLGVILKSTPFTSDFGTGQINGFSTALADIVSGIDGGSHASAFSTISKLRNTTGHKVIWDDIFSNPENYKSLFEQEVNAILYLITKKFLQL